MFTLLNNLHIINDNRKNDKKNCNTKNNYREQLI